MASRLEFVAVIEGTEPIVGVGLLITPEEPAPASEATEPAGLDGIVGLGAFIGAGVGLGKAGEVEIVEGVGR